MMTGRGWPRRCMVPRKYVRISRAPMMFKLTSHSLIAAVLPVVLAMGTGTVRAQPAPPAQGPQDPYDPQDDVDEPDDAVPEQSGPAEAAPQPQVAQPREQPPAPPAMPPQPPPQQRVQVQPVQPAQPSASGQWVYTQQYGWVWMPYGDQY